MSEAKGQKVTSGKGKVHRKTGDVYLAVVDDTEESLLALRYVSRRAKASNGHVALVYMIRRNDFQPWGNVESKMRKERREEAENLMQYVAQQVYDLSGIMPSIYLEDGEGRQHDIVTNIVEQDENIKVLVLGAHSGSSGPGPLVSYFCGKGLAKLDIILAIIPGHLDETDVDALALGH